jgi:O-antigen biosynthesis protein
MELSVIIVNYNVGHFLEQCLISVIEASENIECEIFVVDNNSTDGSCSMVTSRFPEVKLLRNKINTGFSAANNQASGRFILLLNPDTVVKEDTFRKCINFMNEHPDAGAIGVQMIDGKGRLLPESKRALPDPKTAFFKIIGLSRIFPKSPVFNKYYLAHLDSSKTSRADVISGAFIFLNREALDKIGLLDEKFFMYGEDIDLCYRLLKAGYNNYYFPETQIIHFKGKSTSRNNFTDILHFYKAMRIYVKKRSEEGNFNLWYFFIIPAIYLREGLALLNRFFRIIFRR